MSKVERKYQARVMSNKWNTLTNKEEQIIALKAQIAAINSFKPKKEYPTKHKNTNKKSDTAVQQRSSFTGSHAWRN
jgi:23S rRNA maturation mini-RNase III